MDDVVAEPVNWLWPARLPFGMLTLLDGDPGLGKSTIAIDFAARLTAGRPFPGMSSPVRQAAVVFLCAEDSAEHVVRPRLEAAGADLAHCHIIDGMPDGDTTRPAILPNDLPFVERLCSEHGVKLLVVDPLMAFLCSRVDTHSDHSARRALTALKLTAEKTGAAVLALRHLNKQSGGPALYRGGGSIAFTAQARVVLSVGRNPNRPDERLLAVSKSNLAPTPKALGYDLEAVPVGPCEVSRVKWGEASDLTADDIVSRPVGSGGPTADKRDRAEDFLRRELAAGPVSAKQLEGHADAEDIRRGTLNKAADRLGVRKAKEGFAGGWVWSLPTSDTEDSLPEDPPPPVPSESSAERRETAKIHAPEPPKIHSAGSGESSAPPVRVAPNELFPFGHNVLPPGRRDGERGLIATPSPGSPLPAFLSPQGERERGEKDRDAEVAH